MQDTLNSKKHGDTAFRAKDFATAIDSYTQVSHLCHHRVSFLQELGGVVLENLFSIPFRRLMFCLFIFWP